MTMSRRTIIFDLDETLIHEKKSVDEAFFATCSLAEERHGIEPGALEDSVRVCAKELWWNSPMRQFCVDVSISSWEGLAGPFHGEDETYAELDEWSLGYREKAWFNALSDHGVDDVETAKLLAEAFPVERRSRQEAYDESAGVLEKLRDRFRLAILTNGATSVQHGKIDGTHIRSFFDTIVVSGDYGFAKPKAEIFEITLRELSCMPSEAVMVGDSLGKDIAGAQGVGIKGVWVNRAGGENEGDVEPDLVISCLEEICDGTLDKLLD